MNDVVQAAALASIGPTLIGVAALVQSTLGKREAAAANRAVNHAGVDEPTLVDKVSRIDRRVAGLVDELQTVTADVGEARKDLASCATEIGRVHTKVDRHLAHHQAQYEAQQRSDRT